MIKSTIINFDNPPKSIFTSNFSNYKFVPNPIAISRSKPKWFLGDNLDVLAPPWKLVESYKNGDIDKLRYCELYFKYISDSKIDVLKIIEKIPNHSTLLCWEASTDFCHRHLITWLFIATGTNIHISEIKRLSSPKVNPYLISKTIPIINFSGYDKEINSNLKLYGMSIYRNVIIVWNEKFDKSLGSIINIINDDKRKNLVLITATSSNEIILLWRGLEQDIPFGIKSVELDNEKKFKILYHMNINGSWKIDNDFNYISLLSTVDAEFEKKFQLFASDLIRRESSQ